MRRHDRTEPSDMKIVFLDRATISPQTTLRPFAFAHELIVHERTATDDVARRIEDADIVITNKARLSAAALAGAPKLRLIAVAATGTDIVDLAACRERGLHVGCFRPPSVPAGTSRLRLTARADLETADLDLIASVLGDVLAEARV